MSSQPLVSIIIPVHNSERFISRTIQSAIAQTWTNKEIIIIDDGSQDNSLSIVESFAQDGIKVYAQKNHGASAARNLGLKHANGEFIQFLDADDFLSPNKIAAQVAILKHFPGYLGLCGTVYFNDGEEPVGQMPQHLGYSEGSEAPVDFLIKLYAGDLIQKGFGGMIQPNAWLTPKKIIDQAGLWNTKITLDDDGEFFCRVVLASNGIKYSKEAINYYRKHVNSKNLSGKNSHLDFKNMLEGNKLKLNYIFSKSNSNSAKTAMSRVFWESSFTLYPIHKELANEASRIAKEIDSSFIYNPYNGIKYLLAKILGWRKVKVLQHFKHSALVKFGLRR